MADLKKEQNVLNTRIKLRYASYAEWQASTVTLLPGEVALCYVEANNTEIKNTAPTVLFKVGDGAHTFSGLKWASARAADVYDWAKASENPSYTKEEADGKFAVVGHKHDDLYAAKVHDHDTLYYRNSEIDTKVEELNKAIGDVRSALETDTNTTYRFVTEGSTLTVYSKELGGSEVEAGKFTVDFSAINAEIAKKLDAETFNTFKSGYDTTIAGINESLAKKLEANDIADKADKSYVDTELAKKADASSVYTKEESDGKFSVIGHNHDDIYYRNYEIDSKVEDIHKAIGITEASIEDLAETVGGIDSVVDSLVENMEDVYGENGEINTIKGSLTKAEGKISTLEGHFAEGGRVTEAESKISTLEGHFAEGGRVTEAESKISTLETTVGNLSGAFQFKGTVDSIEKLPAASKDNAGHVYVVGSKEYASDGSTWILLGDESSWVLKTTYADHLTAQAAVDKGQSDAIKAIEDDIKANRENWASKTSVAKSETNGNILVDGDEVAVYNDSALAGRVKALEDNPYQLPSDVVRDSEYKHITVTENSVSAEGGATFTKYDDTALAGRVTAVENEFKTVEGTKGKVVVLEEKVSALEAKPFDTYATKSELSGVEGKVDGVIADYLKGSDKTELEGKINNKQDIITDLETIRSGATAGATAVQPGAIEDMLTKTEAEGIYETKANVTAVSNRVTAVENEFKTVTVDGTEVKGRVVAIEEDVKAIKEDATILRSTDYILFDCGGAN